MKPFLTLLKIETRLVLRGVDTIFFGIGFPAVVAVFMGILVKDAAIFSQSFAAISTIGICATGLMGMPLTIAEYRHRNVLKRYQVTPMSPVWLLLVQFLIQLTIALCPLAVVYWIMHICFNFQFQGSIAAYLGTFLLISFAIYGLGMMIASVSRNMKTANFLCTLLYFPMIFLSGTVIPYDMMPGFLQHCMDISPLTQGIKVLNSIALQTPITLWQPLLLLTIMGILCTIISITSFKWTA